MSRKIIAYFIGILAGMMSVVLSMSVYHIPAVIAAEIQAIIVSTIVILVLAFPLLERVSRRISKTELALFVFILLVATIVIGVQYAGIEFAVNISSSISYLIINSSAWVVILLLIAIIGQYKKQ